MSVSLDSARKGSIAKYCWLLLGLGVIAALFAIRPMVCFHGDVVHGHFADHGHGSPLLLDDSAYPPAGEGSLLTQLKGRVSTQPFNIVALVIFLCAIIHTFFTHKFLEIAHRLEERHKAKSADAVTHGARFEIDPTLEADRSFSAEFFHFLGEVEAVFGIWLIPLIAALSYFYSWHTAVDYIQTRDYTEPMFIVAIMALSATRPIVRFAESCLAKVAGVWSESPGAWWMSVLTIGPILGSFITEPAAMTLCAMLLSKQFYRFDPPAKFKYATLGLLFTNISVGGTLTHFAAPPVLMVAKAWGWDAAHMFTNFGWKAVVGILISNALYFWYFRKSFALIAENQKDTERFGPLNKELPRPIPVWITAVHLALLGWTIFTNHYPALFIGSFLLFLAFYQATAAHQSLLELRGPILVGCFLAGLVVHGGLQAWWISAVLQKVNEGALMISAITLTAFNDNAAITYLTTLVPNFSDTMKYAVVSGAVAGGGLTVIANAPNPAGYSLLGRHFENGISAVGLFLAAAIPTTIVSLCLALF